MEFRLVFIIVFVTIFPLFNAQSFEYERMWGTYFGPPNTYFGAPEELSGGFFVNPADHTIHLNGYVIINNNLGSSFYNQYVVNSTNYVDMGQPDNYIHPNFLPNGSISSSGYYNNNGIVDISIAADSFGRLIYEKRLGSPMTDVGTPNTWFVTDPNPASSQIHKVLYKKDVNGTIIFKTFLPDNSESNLIIQDELDNLYIIGNTNLQQGITTAGTWQPNYEVYYPPNTTSPLDNMYIAKLSATGQLMWASYFPGGHINSLSYYNGHLYIVGGTDLNPANTQMSTPNVWQTNKTDYSLTKMDTATGNRVWGTYIGSSNTNHTAMKVKVNSTGIYLMGYEYNWGNSTGYFASLGAYKPLPTGFSDLYLCKLDETGNKVWGTYFGSNGEEVLSANNTLDISDQYIFIAGANKGAGNNIATPGAFQDTKPTAGNGGTDLFFAKFNTNGVFQWCSYYGGSNSNPSLNINDIGIYTDGNNTLYLYGNTTSASGIATEGAYQQSLPPNISTYTTGFLARFDLKNGLGTDENQSNQELVLIDNPNNGNFALIGNMLVKENFLLTIYDTSGRVIYTTALPKKQKIEMQLSHLLVPGNYFVCVGTNKNENKKTFKMIVK